MQSSSCGATSSSCFSPSFSYSSLVFGFHSILSTKVSLLGKDPIRNPPVYVISDSRIPGESISLAWSILGRVNCGWRVKDTQCQKAMHPLLPHGKGGMPLRKGEGPGLRFSARAMVHTGPFQLNDFFFFSDSDS